MIKFPDFNIMSKVLELIKFDQTLRYNKKYDTVENEDLFTLDQLDVLNEWDYDLPYLYTYDILNRMISDKLPIIDEFKELFYIECPFLKNIDWGNILIAGGCISNCLSRLLISDHNMYNFDIKDIDIFIYAESDELATDVVHRVLKHIVDSKKRDYIINKVTSSINNLRLDLNIILNVDDSLKTQINDNINKYNNIDDIDEKLFNIKFSRNKYTLEIDEYQIIFRRYSSKSEILHGFDIGSCAVGFDGTNVHFTSLSKFAFETGYNIIDTTRRSTTYESRLSKYFRRGFGIIMPEFDISKLIISDDAWRTLYLPFVEFTYKNINHNGIQLDFGGIRPILAQGSDYNNYYEDMKRYINITKLAHNKCDEVYYNSQTKQGILNPRIKINKQDLKCTYADILWKIMNRRVFPCNTVYQCITVRTINEIIKNKDNKKYLDNIIKLQIEEIVNRIENMQPSVISWISADPGTQLTSSFNPIIEDSSIWYGSYYIKKI